MNTDYHSIDELPTNERFIASVLDTKSNPNEYWDEYKRRNLHESEKIEEAIQLVKELNAAKVSPTPDQKVEILEFHYLLNISKLFKK